MATKKVASQLARKGERGERKEEERRDEEEEEEDGGREGEWKRKRRRRWGRSQDSPQLAQIEGSSVHEV